MTTKSTVQLDRLRVLRERLRPSDKPSKCVPVTSAEVRSYNVLERIAANHGKKLCPVCMVNFISVGASDCSHGKDA